MPSRIVSRSFLNIAVLFLGIYLFFLQNQILNLRGLPRKLVIKPGEFAMLVALGGLRGVAADLLYIKADALWKEGKWEDIKSLYRAITFLQPDYADYWSLAGHHLAWNLSFAARTDKEREKYINQGLEFLKEGLTYNQDVYKLYFDLGFIYDHKVKDYDEAIKWYAKAVRFSRHPTYIDRAIAHALRKKGDLAAALKEWLRLKELYKDDEYHQEIVALNLKLVEDELKKIWKNNRIRILFIALSTVLSAAGIVFSGGKFMKTVELDEGITLNVPRNFPKAAIKDKDGIRNISFSMKPHQGSQRFVHFFEIILSPKEFDFTTILPESGYRLGKAAKEEISINEEKGNLKTAELEIIYSCGSKEKTKLYAFEHFCKAKNKYVSIITFTMTKKGFLDIVRTFAMSLEKLFTALILGLSWERILCCPFIALSLSLSDRWAGLRFILGRLAGICLLGSIISLVGVPFRISPVILDSAFGLFLIFLGINTFLKTGHKSGQKQFARAGFGLGIFRGSLNPGRKIIYLLPLLWGVGVLEGLAISLAYALSSSVYLLIGFFSAELLNKIVSHQKAIKFFGGIILVILGIFYFIKALQAKG